MGLCGNRDFKEVIKVKQLGQALSNRTGVLLRDADTDRHREKTMWTHREEKAALYKPRKEASEETNPANT